MQDPRKRTFPEDSYPPRSAPFRGSSPAGNAYAPYASSDAGRAPPKRGRGKGPTSTIDAGFTPTTEHRIPVDISSFPLDSNIIMQLLGPRGRHQQRMKNDSDTIVTTTGKGSRGPLAPGEEPLSLVIRSKDPSIPLTQRQIAVVHQIYEDILHHVREYEICHYFVCTATLRNELDVFLSLLLSQKYSISFNVSRLISGAHLLVSFTY
jgi:hypothetical protein